LRNSLCGFISLTNQIHIADCLKINLCNPKQAMIAPVKEVNESGAIEK